MSKCCTVDGCVEAYCVLDAGHDTSAADCNMALKLAAEGKGRDDCRYWTERPLSELEKAEAEVARLRKMRRQAQDILGHTVPKNLSPELAEMWAAAIKVLEG